MENYKIIAGHNGVYAISIEGVVKNIRRDWIVKPKLHHTGYYMVGLSRDNKQAQHLLHRLLAKAFKDVPNSDNLVVNHKNGVKTDNRLDNLEWCTYVENARHSINVLNNIPQQAKLNREQVSEIRELLRTNLSITKIATRYNVGRGTISNIKNDRTWRL